MTEEACTVKYRIVRAPGWDPEESPLLRSESLDEARREVEKTRQMLEVQGGNVISAIATTESGETVVLYESDSPGRFVLDLYVTAEGTFATKRNVPPIACSSVDDAERKMRAEERKLRPLGGWIIQAIVKGPDGVETILLKVDPPHDR